MANVLTEILKNLYKNPDAYREASKDSLSQAKNAHVLPAHGNMSNFNAIADNALIRGLITDIRRDSITLLLTDNEIVTARLAAPLPLSIGETASFSVAKREENQIILSLCKNNDIKDNPIVPSSENILKKLGFTVSDKNIEIVKSLLQLKAPISKDSIKAIVTLSGKFPSTSVSDIILLKITDIPVTQRNLEFVGLFSESIISETKNAINEIADAINKETNPSVQSELKKEFEKILNDIFNREPGSDAGMSNTHDAVNFNSPDVKTFVSASDESGSPMPDDLPNFSDKPGLTNSFTLPVSSDTESDLKDAHTEISQKNDFKSDLNDAFKSFFLTPKEISKKENLQNINKHLMSLAAELKKMSEKFTETLDENTDTKEFLHTERLITHAKLMDYVNSVFPFMFIPISFKNENTESELYVYERKKNFNASDSVSVCLHLAMKKLGDTDIFITLSGSALNINISAANEISKKVFESEIDTLSNTLNEKGFKLTCSVSVTKDKITCPDKLLKFIDTCDYGDIQNYTFDVRT